MTYTEIQCPDCKARFSQKALLKTRHRCPECGRQKTSRPWKTFIMK